MPRGPAKRPSFAGTSLVERMRSTTFALLGITTAMGLGLVAMVSQQSWPLLPNAPLPGLSSETGRVHDATPVGAPISASGEARGGSAREAGTDARGRRGAEDAPAATAASPGVSGSRQLATAPAPTSPDPVAESPSGEGAPSEPSPVASAPEATAPDASSPAPVSSSSPSATTSRPTSPPVVASASNPGKDKPSGKPKPSKGKPRSYEPAPAPSSPPPPPKPAKSESLPAPAPAPENALDRKDRDEDETGASDSSAAGRSKK